MLKNAFLLFAVAFMILIVFLPSFTKWQDVKQKDLEYQARIAELEQEKAKLEEERKRLEGDPDYLERVAREKMGLIREGEVVYQLTPEGEKEE